MIEIRVEDITRIHADIVVNAANRELQKGGGVCGAIFEAAGSEVLADACRKIGKIHTGEVVVTPAFGMENAKYIIHAAGPKYRDGRHGEAEKLAACYRNALHIAVDKQCGSIAFPLISSGIYGYPKAEAWEIALRTCQEFLLKHHKYISVYFVVLRQGAKELGMAVHQKVRNEYWLSEAKKFVNVMEVFSQDTAISEWCREFNPYQADFTGHEVVAKWVSGFDNFCIGSGFAFPEMDDPEFMHFGHNKITEENLYECREEWLKTISVPMLRKCINWYVCGAKFNLALMVRGAGNGAFYRVLKEYISRFEKED